MLGRSAKTRKSARRVFILLFLYKQCKSLEMICLPSIAGCMPHFASVTIQTHQTEEFMRSIGMHSEAGPFRIRETLQLAKQWLPATVMPQNVFIQAALQTAHPCKTLCCVCLQGQHSGGWDHKRIMQLVPKHRVLRPEQE